MSGRRGPGTRVRGSIASFRRVEGRQPDVSLRELFIVFLRSGFEFGAGIGMIAFLHREFVEKRRAISPKEFLHLYGLGRIVPSGTLSAIAVAVGDHFRGILGSTVALIAMILPSFVLTVALVVPFQALESGGVMAVLNVTLLPATLAVLIAGSIRMGRQYSWPSVEFALMVIAAVAVLSTGLSVPVTLLAGGVAGAIFIRDDKRQPE